MTNQKADKANQQINQSEEREVVLVVLSRLVHTPAFSFHFAQGSSLTCCCCWCWCQTCAIPCFQLCFDPHSNETRSKCPCFEIKKKKLKKLTCDLLIV